MRRRGAGRSNNVLRTAGPTAPTQPNWFRISLLLGTALTIRKAANAGEAGDRFLLGQQERSAIFYAAVTRLMTIA